VVALAFGCPIGLLALLPVVGARRCPPALPAPPGARFDVIVVLGRPARAGGSPSTILAERADAAARLGHAGAAPRLLVSGAAVHDEHVEAEAMAARARARGVPADAIVLEPLARSTRENARHAAVRMRREGWRAALVVSSPSHLRRAAHWFRIEGVDAAFAPAPPAGALGALRVTAARRWEAWLLLRLACEADPARP
jgi:uncharacterized SAM-binding protein YcdF (DUF218 family)